MKKVLCAVCAVMLTCVMLIVCASAAGGSASLSASATNVNRGDTFTVTVSISGATGVGSIGVMPSYDKSALEFTGGAWLISGALSDVNANNGTALFAFNATSDVDGEVLTLDFKVKDNAGFETYSIGATVKLDGVEISCSSLSVTLVCNHSYTEVADASYLKTAATCTSKAVYYKSCSVPIRQMNLC